MFVYLLFGASCFSIGFSVASILAERHKRKIKAILIRKIESLEDGLVDLCSLCKKSDNCNEVPCNFEHNSVYVQKEGSD